MQFPELTYTFDYKTAGIGGTTIAYTDEGAGEQTLLFIHGLASSISAWQKVVPLLKNKFRCIALDLPGYGKSSAGTHSGSMLYYAGIISAFIQKLGLEKTTIVGHSMGGHIAITTALNYSAIVNKLVLLAPAGLETFTAEETVKLKSYFVPSYYESSTNEQIRSNYVMNFYSMPEEAEKLISNRIQMRDWKNFGNYCRVVSASLYGMLDYPVFERLGEINQRTLIIFGNNDLLIPNGVFHKQLSPETVTVEAARRIKKSTYNLLDSCGHFIPMEKPEETASLIEEFLAHN